MADSEKLRESGTTSSSNNEEIEFSQNSNSILQALSEQSQQLGKFIIYLVSLLCCGIPHFSSFNPYISQVCMITYDLNKYSNP